MCSEQTRKDGDPECETDEKLIEDYLSDISIETWVIHEKVNFGLYGERPAYTVMEFKAQTLLNPKYL